MLLSSCRSFLMSVAVIAFTAAVPLAAQDTTKAPKSANNAEKSENPISAYGSFLKKQPQVMAMFEKEIRALVSQYRTADLEEKKIIEAKFNQAQARIRKLEAKSNQLAIAAASQDPKSPEESELVMQANYQLNRYQRVAQLADELIKADKSEKSALNYGGAAHFAIGNFARAKELLSRAEQQQLTIPRIARNYLPLCDDYEQYWKTEQKLRAAEKEAGDLPQVELDTTKGRIVVELFENEAPNSVANFISLVEKGFYNGIVFHRVIPGFMSQVGCPKTLDDDPNNDGTGGPGYTIDCECTKPGYRRHFQGSLSMAHAGQNTGGSQFFLTHLPTDHLNGKHTVFGRIVEGNDVNLAMQKGDKIKSAKVLRKRKHPYQVEKN